VELDGGVYYATPDVGIKQFIKLISIKKGDNVLLCVSGDKIV